MFFQFSSSSQKPQLLSLHTSTGKMGIRTSRSIMKNEASGKHNVCKKYKQYKGQIELMGQSYSKLCDKSNVMAVDGLDKYTNDPKCKRFRDAITILSRDNPQFYQKYLDKLPDTIYMQITMGDFLTEIADKIPKTPKKASAYDIDMEDYYDYDYGAIDSIDFEDYFGRRQLLEGNIFDEPNHGHDILLPIVLIIVLLFIACGCIISRFGELKCRIGGTTLIDLGETNQHRSKDSMPQNDNYS